jgi:glycosyltransferase involved in cell wall biosynthesis
MNKTITIAIDGRPLTRGKGGIQRYLQSVLKYMAGAQNLDIIVYSDGPLADHQLEQLPSLRIRTLPENSSSKAFWYIFSCLWAFKDKPDFYWSPRHHLPMVLPKHTKKIVTIHDVVWKTYPKTLPKIKFWAERVLMPMAIKSADHIICVSNTTKDQVSSLFPRTKEKSTVILNGFDMPPFKAKAFGNHSNFYLAVGTLEPRKNYEILIQGFDHYADLGGTNNLIIVGKNGWSFESIYLAQKNAAYKDKITILTDVNDALLDELYRTSLAFISTSYDEGFGLPAIEAHVRGCPILLSDIAVYRELFPFAKCWLDTSSEQLLGQQLFDSELEPRSPNEPLGKKFNHITWQQCAEQHLNLFLKLDANE